MAPHEEDIGGTGGRLEIRRLEVGAAQTIGPVKNDLKSVRVRREAGDSTDLVVEGLAPLVAQANRGRLLVE